MKRLYAPLLKEYLRIFPCVAIVGPRQCGKTTLLGTLPAGWKRFDLERASDFEQISRDPGLFLRLSTGHVALDECQLLPELFPALRVAIDAARHKKGRFVITGSSSPQLMRSVSETLAGRVGIIEMAPFSLDEAYAQPSSSFFRLFSEKRIATEDWLAALRSRLSLEDCHRYWWRGGYPEPWLMDKERSRDLWMEQYVRTYIERDLLRLFPGLNAERFRRFIFLLAGLSGHVITYSDIARTLSVSQPTAKDYFDIAHGTFLWRQVLAYDKKSHKRLVRHPRGYLRDNGLLHHLLRIPDPEGLLVHPKMGSSWEGMIVEQILRGLACAGVAADYSYYRTSGGAEVDLVLEGAFGLIAIEIKHTQTVSSRDLQSLSDFVDEQKARLGIVITSEETVRRFSEKIIGIPCTSL